MNIDFHYGIIYVVSRLAGLPPTEAETVAHACQYIDDATTNGILEFAGGQTFERFASAHQSFDYLNFFDRDSRQVWAPFHFLPGGEGESFEKQVVCRKNSKVAREMVRRFLQNEPADHRLHGLGILLHTYVDTWAHQGFSGTQSPHNAVHEFFSEDYVEGDLEDRVKAELEQAWANVEGAAIDLAVKVGHGAAIHFPDLPWFKWRYRNGFGEKVERDNLPDFVEAANMAYKVVRAHLSGTVDFESVENMDGSDAAAIREVLKSNRSHDEQERLAAIGQQLCGGKLASIAESLPPYVPKGPGSWKEKGTGLTTVDDGDEAPEWSEEFEGSDYRKFHDAVKEHRLDVTQYLLPSFGIRLA